MIIDILTLFPSEFDGIINSSIIKRAIEAKIVTINVIDYREYSNKKNKRVDDYSYGGGAGMIIEVQPIYDALKAIDEHHQVHRIITSPHGTKFSQTKAQELSKLKHIIFVCGHYEGIDSRIDNYIDEKISIGDFILTGGEIATMAIIDAIIRLLPNVLGNDESSIDESFENNLLEYPQYTRPPVFDGHEVPKVLLSGDHQKIEKWRMFMSLKETFENREDLLKNKEISEEQKLMLDMIKEGKTFDDYLLVKTQRKNNKIN